ncbi:MAG: sugar transferase [Lachnospiraceae bacterium]|nr:sugar transferase [Lachnospiraceae bacterium]
MYKKTSQNWLKHLDFIIIDMICLQIAFVLAYISRHGWCNPFSSRSYMQISIIFMMFGLFTSTFFDSFKNVLKRGCYKELTMTIRHVGLVELLTIFYLFSIQSVQQYSRIVVYMTGIIYAILGYAARVTWKAHLREKMKNSGGRSLVIITTKTLAAEVIRNIKENNYEMFHLAGIAVIDEDMTGQEIEGIRVVAFEDDVADYVCRAWVDEVYINIPNNIPYPKAMINQFIEMGVIVHMNLVNSSNLSANRQVVERLGNYTVLTTSINLASSRQLLFKRLLDIAGGLTGCLITGILVLAIGPAIYIQSPGPIFFSQERIGKNGKRFKMYKFRSMYMDAEERKKELMKENRVKDGMMFKLDWDPRIIGSKKLPDGTMKKGIGNYIRDLSLDEFPQFFNVLKGDMSLVGTRPPTVDEWDKYELHHRARLATKPGVTGMWQVSGRSNITDFEEVVRLDKKYISEWSMGLDFKILLKTVGVVLKKEGSM